VALPSLFLSNILLSSASCPASSSSALPRPSLSSSSSSSLPFGAADEGERHRQGGLVGEVEGYLWMRRQWLGAVGEGGGGRLRQQRRGGGAMQKWCGVCSRVPVKNY
jgi:hypothetical protein